MDRKLRALLSGILEIRFLIRRAQGSTGTRRSVFWIYPKHGYLTAGTSLSSQAILVAHFVFGCAGRRKEMKKSAPWVQVISCLGGLLITIALIGDRVSQAWRNGPRRKEGLTIALSVRSCSQSIG